MTDTTNEVALTFGNNTVHLEVLGLEHRLDLYSTPSNEDVFPYVYVRVPKQGSGFLLQLANKGESAVTLSILLDERTKDPRIVVPSIVLNHQVLCKVGMYNPSDNGNLRPFQIKTTGGGYLGVAYSSDVYPFMTLLHKLEPMSIVVARIVFLTETQFCHRLGDKQST